MLGYQKTDFFFNGINIYYRHVMCNYNYLDDSNLVFKHVYVLVFIICYKEITVLMMLEFLL